MLIKYLIDTWLDVCMLDNCSDWLSRRGHSTFFWSTSWMTKFSIAHNSIAFSYIPSPKRKRNRAKYDEKVGVRISDKSLSKHGRVTDLRMTNEWLKEHARRTLNASSVAWLTSTPKTIVSFWSNILLKTPSTSFADTFSPRHLCRIKNEDSDYCNESGSRIDKKQEHFLH